MPALLALIEIDLADELIENARHGRYALWSRKTAPLNEDFDLAVKLFDGFGKIGLSAAAVVPMEACQGKKCGDDRGKISRITGKDRAIQRVAGLRAQAFKIGLAWPRRGVGHIAAQRSPSKSETWPQR